MFEVSELLDVLDVLENLFRLKVSSPSKVISLFPTDKFIYPVVDVLIIESKFNSDFSDKI